MSDLHCYEGERITIAGRSNEEVNGHVACESV